MLYAWKSVYGRPIAYFMIKIYFKTASLPRGLDKNRKWSVSQNDQYYVDTAFLLWRQKICACVLHVDNPEKDYANHLLTSIESCQLHQRVTGATHNKGRHTLDLVITRARNLFVQVARIG